MLLTLILPTFNEAQIIEQTLRDINAHIEKSLLASTEVLIVDDGTDELIEKVNLLRSQLSFARLEVLRNPSPLGKGGSIVKGIFKAHGEVVGFIDADLSTPPSYLAQMIDAFQNNRCDVFIGSRRIQGAQVKRKQFFMKYILAGVLHFFTEKILFLNMRVYRDTQCGFKFFKAPVAQKLFSQLIALDGMTDLEVMIRANLFKLRVTECPVTWTDLRESKRSLRRVLLGDMKSLLKIFWHYSIRRRSTLAKLAGE